MDYDVRVCEVTATPLAVARGFATRETLGRRIVELLDEVYRFQAQKNMHQAGLNVVVYRQAPEAGQSLAPGGFPVEAGVQVEAPFPSAGTVVCAATPAGPVATTTHMGPYEGLPQAHAAVRQWCGDEGRALAGPRWEIYGHWHDDPDQRRTDVYYLLA